MEKSDFDSLLKRYLDEKVSEEEKARIEAWLDLDKTWNEGQFVWKKDDGDILFRKIMRNIDDGSRAAKPAGAVKKIFRISPWIRVAATVLILVTASRPNWYAQNGLQIYETIASCDIERITLKDGTVVWLRKDSRLAYFERSKGMRHASLVGEALFEVAKDSRRPFTISCGKVTVRGPQSSFSLKNRTDSVELRVLSGKVNLSSRKDHTGINIAPNEGLVCTVKGSNVDKSHRSTCRESDCADLSHRGQQSIISEVLNREFKSDKWRRCFPRRKRA